MPGSRRRVRFSTATTFHSPPPSPPQLSWSSSSSSGTSSESSSGPLTPPSAIPYVDLPPPSIWWSHSSDSATSSSGPLTPPFCIPHPRLPGPSPYAARCPSHAHAPAHVDAPPRAHALLALSAAPLLHYDLSIHPSGITAHFPNIPSSGLRAPATTPPRPVLTITIAIASESPHLHLPWPWPIHAMASNGRAVTVSDALTALYRALRENVTAAEYHRALLGPGAPVLKQRVGEAYRRRYERMRVQGHRGYGEEKRQGVKRVDFLMGRTEFRGLEASGVSGVWRLHVA
ncbi:hypothetical protein C8R46DRAFT_917064 [Mycena filopes]|nr:hypothetical protein C8R46DRAFT_917064 [Mycena filopes]